MTLKISCVFCHTSVSEHERIVCWPIAMEVQTEVLCMSSKQFSPVLMYAISVLMSTKKI